MYEKQKPNKLGKGIYFIVNQKGYATF